MATATPIIAPVVNLNPASQAPVASQSANSNATVAISNAPSRPRLPAQSLAPAANAATRPGSTEVDSTRLISRVVRAVSAAHERDGEVHLRLSPPELGSLRLDVRVENGTLTAHVQTETDAARTAIIDNLPALRDRLADQGVRIDRFDVDLMQRQPGGMPDQPGGRQPDMPEVPLRFAPPTRSTAATAPIATSSSPSLGNSGGLNVVI
jgi:flagellar hook-length control protein FliK